MKFRLAILACAVGAAFALSACGTSGITLGATGSGTLAKGKAFVDRDLDNAHANYVAANDTVRAPCPVAIKQWFDGLPGQNNAIVISGVASGISAVDIAINGTKAGWPDYLYVGCGPLALKDVREFNQLLALVATLHP